MLESWLPRMLSMLGRSPGPPELRAQLISRLRVTVKSCPARHSKQEEARWEAKASSRLLSEARDGAFRCILAHIDSLAAYSIWHTSSAGLSEAAWPE